MMPGSKKLFPEIEGCEGFSAYYEEHIRPLRQSIENYRLQLVRRFYISAVISFLVIAATAVLTINVITYITNNNYFLLFLGIGLVVMGIATWIVQPFRHYKNTMKHEVFARIIRFFGGFSYYPDGSINIAALQPSGIIPHYNRFHAEDIIVGTYKDVEIQLAETHLQKAQYVQGNTGRIKGKKTLFKGLFVVLAMNKHFSGKTVIVKDKGLIGNIFSSSIAGLERVSLEDPQFERKFEAYSTDQIEARYLLTTAFMERLVKLAELFIEADQGKFTAGNIAGNLLVSLRKVQAFARNPFNKHLHCSFFDDKLLITLPCRKNLFEPASLFTSALRNEDVRKFLEEMRLVFDIVDILKLDRKIGL